MDINKIGELAVQELVTERENYQSWLDYAKQELERSVYIDSYNEELRVRARTNKEISDYTVMIEAIDAELARRGSPIGERGPK